MIKNMEKLDATGTQFRGHTQSGWWLSHPSEEYERQLGW